MDKPLPDETTCAEVAALVDAVQSKHAEIKAHFVAPVYDFELLAAFLQDATTTLRDAWTNYVDPCTSAWQTLRAFAYRMRDKKGEFRYLMPVAQFRSAFMASLQPFVSTPVRWSEEITGAHKTECIERLKQEITQQIQRYFYDRLLECAQPGWNYAAELRGTGTTPIMRKKILDIIFSAAPELTEEHAKVFKDAIKGIIENAIVAASEVQSFAVASSMT